jgi:hypothetical protein
VLVVWTSGSALKRALWFWVLATGRHIAIVGGAAGHFGRGHAAETECVGIPDCEIYARCVVLRSPAIYT